VRVYWDSTSTSPVATVTARANGSFVTSFTVPLSVNGTHSIIAVGQADGRSAVATVVVRPALSVTPHSGPPSSSAVVTGRGFAASEVVTVRWDCGSHSCSSPLILGSRTTDANGSLSLSVAIPRGATPGAYIIGGTGSSSNRYAMTSFTVTS
jgi:hypothetical protein